MQNAKVNVFGMDMQYLFKPLCRPAMLMHRHISLITGSAMLIEIQQCCMHPVPCCYGERSLPQCMGAVFSAAPWVLDP